MELTLDPKYHQGDVFRVVAHDNAEENVYIQHATINGQDLDRAWLTHEEITAGATLEFHMGPEANEEWGSAVEHRLPSLVV